MVLFIEKSGQSWTAERIYLIYALLQNVFLHLVYIEVVHALSFLLNFEQLAFINSLFLEMSSTFIFSEKNTADTTKNEAKTKKNPPRVKLYSVVNL